MAVDPRRVALQNILLGGEDAMDEDEVLVDAPLVAPVASSQSTELIDKIITPSPFPHHTTGPTASRFRNSFLRVSQNPESDVEAWQALMTEVMACYRSISNLHAVDAELQLQLDWMESCYGCLLKYFPYSSTHYTAIAEMLFRLSSQVGEPEGPPREYGVDLGRAQHCQGKLERIFEKTLGIQMDGSPANPDDPIGGMCTSSVELWLLYIQTRNRQAQRQFPNDETNVRQWTTKAYELAIDHAGFGYSNHLLWKHYLGYAKVQTSDPQHMVHLRSIYQRLVCHPMTGLDQLWQEYEAFERQQSEALATALVSEYTPKYQHARTVYLERNRVFHIPDLQITKLAIPPSAEERHEEHEYLQLWKKRCAYERTNPERLGAAELVIRVRQAYKEMACVLTQHPEVWHMWSMYEETLKGGGEIGIEVLKKGQKHIPDCTLLAYAQAQLVELHTSTPSDCIQVLEDFLERAPNTLGFALLQQLVRRYKGKDAARAVFARARRVLTVTPEKEDAKEEIVEGEETKEASNTKKEEDNGKRWMVTNRLDPSVGKETKTSANPEDSNESSSKLSPGPITWHLYASHATIEHRLNHSPAIAARVYELGLRKHASFLTQSPYVLRYAYLLLELQDTVNLRALLTRALSASDKSVGSLWDMTLEFEQLIATADPTNVQAALTVERKRRAALMGADKEDVATGGAPDLQAQSQKSTVSEQLIRQDGYDMSSMIVNGLSRTVDVLDIMGLWGDGSNSKRFSKDEDEDDECLPGGPSDASYQLRLRYARLAASGGNVEGEQSSKLLSARERLQQQQPSQNTAISMAIQQSPEWLKSLLLLLPASRRGVLHKPPPHLTEMALATLRQSNLPAERPKDAKSNAVSGNKHGRGGGGDSSDEENGGRASGGYGLAFRARQRARQIAASQSIKSESN